MHSVSTARISVLSAIVLLLIFAMDIWTSVKY
jgi:hypothetical protein